MKHRPCLCLLLVGALGLGRPARASAQDRRIPPGVSRPVIGNITKPLRVPLPQRQSHRRLGEFPADLSGAEEMVAQRIQTAGRQRLMQNLIDKFRDDPNFLRQLRDEADLTQDEMDDLRLKIMGTEKFDQDPTWRNLLEGAQASGRLTKDERDILNEWAAQRPDVSEPRPGFQPPDTGTPGSLNPGTPRSGPAQTPPSGPDGESGSRPENFWDWSGKQVQDATKELITSVSDAFDADDTPDGRSLRNAIRQFGRGDFKGGGFGLDLTKYAPGLSGYLPNWRKIVPLDKLSPRGFASLFRGTGLPQVPRFRGRSFPTVPHGSGSHVGEGLLWCLVFLALGAVGWKVLRRYRAAAVERSGRRWRLGPWPVAPAEVSSRAELVAAFEYLAFLRLGLPARACNHHEVADRLAGTDGLRRRAAAELARIYEQARYAPGDEPLAHEDLTAARRDLCFLAGVASA